MQWWEELAEAKDEGRLEGHEAGRLEGQKSGALHKLISMVVKKLQKGKAVDVIAEELEEDIAFINKICDVAIEFATEYDVNKILERLISEE